MRICSNVSNTYYNSNHTVTNVNAKRRTVSVRETAWKESGWKINDDDDDDNGVVKQLRWFVVCQISAKKNERATKKQEVKK